MGAPNERTVANWYSFLKYKTTPAVSLLPAISVRGALFSNGRNGGGTVILAVYTALQSSENAKQ